MTDFYIVYYLCSSIGPWGATSYFSAFPGRASARAAPVICLIKLGNLVSQGPRVTVSIAHPPIAGLNESFTPLLLDLSVTVSHLVCWLIWDSGSPGPGRLLSLLSPNPHTNLYVSAPKALGREQRHKIRWGRLLTPLLSGLSVVLPLNISSCLPSPWKPLYQS